MALKLTKGQPKPQAVPLGGGVTLWMRPATYPESMEAAERIQPMIVALREGSAAAAEVQALLGDEFVKAQWDDPALYAAAQKLATMELIELCFDRIEGKLLDADDVEITTVDAAVAALLMRDPPLARLITAVIGGPLHEVIEEKKESPALPNGEAGIPDTAPVAAPQEAPAP